jgi:nitrate reductase assembly molybdenum cofactor insertion protein NarJ
MERTVLFDHLAGLLAYPGRDFHQRIEACVAALAGTHPAAAERLEPFRAAAAERSVEQLQEMFIRNFDLNPAAALEIGWHLFGEQYERGELLVRMRRLLRRFALPESVELPDHLTHALAVLGRMEGKEADDFAAACIYPALDKMRDGVRQSEGIFVELLEAVAEVLAAHHLRPEQSGLPPMPALRVLEERNWR